MTTAVLTRPAVASMGGHWATRSACRTAEADRDFYGTSARAQARAREVCATCPVLVQCLAARSAVDAEEEPWGMVGGLDAYQRRVLKVAELIGERPNLERAKELLTPRWRYRLHKLRSSGYAPHRIAEFLTSEGCQVDAITVRVALWWTGGTGKALARRAPHDRRYLWQRVRDQHADVIRRLRGAGARHSDVADYLGVPVGSAARAVQQLESAA